MSFHPNNYTFQDLNMTLSFDSDVVPSGRLAHNTPEHLHCHVYPEHLAPSTSQDRCQSFTTNVYTGSNGGSLLDGLEFLDLRDFPQESHQSLEQTPILYPLESPASQAFHHLLAAVLPQVPTSHVSVNSSWGPHSPAASSPYGGSFTHNIPPDLLTQTSFLPQQSAYFVALHSPSNYEPSSPFVWTHQSLLASNLFEGSPAVLPHLCAHPSPLSPLPAYDHATFTSQSSPSSSDSDSPVSPVGRLPRAAPPRNIQITRSCLSTISSPSSSTEPHACPFCGFVPKSFYSTYLDKKASYSADLKRHIRTHLGATVLCCGVPLEDVRAGLYTVDPSLSTPKLFNGRWMVGGCGKWLSRKDALKRHLENGSNKCVGDVNGDWHSYNQ